MDPILRFLDKISYKFPKGYPDVDDPKDKQLLLELTKSFISEENPGEFGYKIGEFTTPSETLASRNWYFLSKVGYLGTGHYYYGDEENAKKDKEYLERKSNIKKIDLSKYNLFRADNPEHFYDNLKLITRELGLYASHNGELDKDKLNEALDEIYDIIKNDLKLPLEKDKVFEILTGFVKDIKSKKDGPLLSNRLLKPLGYDGIDNRDTKLDNYGVGSVIFIDSV